MIPNFGFRIPDEQLIPNPKFQIPGEKPHAAIVRILKYKQFTWNDTRIRVPFLSGIRNPELFNTQLKPFR